MVATHRLTLSVQIVSEFAYSVFPNADVDAAKQSGVPCREFYRLGIVEKSQVWSRWLPIVKTGSRGS